MFSPPSRPISTEDSSLLIRFGQAAAQVRTSRCLTRFDVLKHSSSCQSSPGIITFNKMDCKINALQAPVLCRFSSRRLSSRIRTFALSSNIEKQQESISSTVQKTGQYSVNFRTLGAGKLGIGRYPDFEYNAQGGTGTGIGTKSGDSEAVIAITFDLETLYIPPLSSETTRFLGLPLPPPLKIDIVPELFEGKIHRNSGEVELQFVARFLFSAGSLYKAPPLLVKTVLTSEESTGKIRSGKGQRLDNEGKCRLVGVAYVDPINDVLMNTFLGLPTECLADLSAIISLIDSS